MNIDSNGTNNRLSLQVRIRCGLLSITTPVSLLANEFDARVKGLAAVNHFLNIHQRHALNMLILICENYNIGLGIQYKVSIKQLKSEYHDLQSKPLCHFSTEDVHI